MSGTTAEIQALRLKLRNAEARIDFLETGMRLVRDMSFRQNEPDASWRDLNKRELEQVLTRLLGE